MNCAVQRLAFSTIFPSSAVLLSVGSVACGQLHFKDNISEKKNPRKKQFVSFKFHSDYHGESHTIVLHSIKQVNHFFIQHIHIIYATLLIVIEWLKVIKWTFMI